MQDLIKRLEEATEGSRELDVQIAESLGWHVYDATALGHFVMKRPGQLGSEAIALPLYTRSLDAAFSLVPAGYSIVLHGSWQDGNPDGWKAQVAPNVRDAWRDDMTGATGPLALCIAALRAHKRG